MFVIIVPILGMLRPGCASGLISQKVNIRILEEKAESPTKAF